MTHRTAGRPAAAGHRFRTKPEALTKALEAFTARPSYAAYKALIIHYGHCPGCAHDTAPCPTGRKLRQAWAAVRWS